MIKEDILKRSNKRYKIKRRKNGTFAKGKWIKKRKGKRGRKKVNKLPEEKNERKDE